MKISPARAETRIHLRPVAGPPHAAPVAASPDTDPGTGRLSSRHVWRSLGVAGLLLGCSSAGSDAPVEDLAPFGTARQAVEQSPFASVTLLPGSVTPLSQEEHPPGFINDVPEVPWSPPACEQPLGQALTRNACPAEPPAVTPCEVEGLECRYPGDGNTARLHECIYGRWSFVMEEQSGKQAPAPLPNSQGPLENPASCPASDPLPDALCTGAAACGYSRCALGGRASMIYNCNCGRWTLEHRSCPID